MNKKGNDICQEYFLNNNSILKIYKNLIINSKQ